MTTGITQKEQVVLDLLIREPLLGSRRVAGELGWRSQDAGRVLRALERKNLAEFHVGPQRAGWRALPEWCCVCGHTAHWHAYNGTGNCEHDGECGCLAFAG